MNVEAEMNKNVRISAGRTLTLTFVALASSLLEAFLSGSALAIIFTVLTSSFSAAAVIFSGTLYPLLIGIGAYGVSFALSLDPIAAITSLEFVPVALILAYSFKKKHPRLTMITTAVLIIFELAFFALALYGTYGKLNAEVIRDFAVMLHESISDTVFETVSQAMPENIPISYDAISDMVAYLLVLAPAMTVTLYNIASYLIQRTVIVIGRHAGAADAIYPEACIFKLSRVAAILYVVSYLVSVFFAQETVSMIGAIAENLIIILTPGLALLGVKDFIKRRKERSLAFPFFPVLGMAFLLFTVPALFFGLAAFAGVWAALRKN